MAVITFKTATDFKDLWWGSYEDWVKAEDDWNAIKETLHLLSIPEMRES